MSSNTVLWGRSRNDLIKLAITVLLPLFIFLVPTNDVFTADFRLFLVITLIAIISFATDSLPQTGVAIALPVAYVVLGIAPGDVVFSAWLNYVPWMMIGALILSLVLEKTQLMKRIAYHCILLTGASYKGIVMGLILAGVIMNLFIMDNSIIPMAALAYGVCRAMNLKPGQASAGIMLAAAFSALTPMNWLYSSNLAILIGLGRSSGGPASIGWFEVIQHQLPMVLYTVGLGVLCLVLFRPEEQINGKDYFRGELNKMGSMSKDEKKALVILLILFALLVTSSLTGLEPGWLFAIVPCLCFLPGVDLMNDQDVYKINWGFIFFIAGCLSIGNVAGSLGVGAAVSTYALPVLEGKSYYVFFLFCWLLFFLCNFLLTPLAMMAAFTQPLTEIAINLGIDPTTVYFIVTSGLDQIVFPYEYALYLLVFAFGMIKMKHFVKAMIFKIILNFVIVFALLVPYWNMMDLIYIH